MSNDTCSIQRGVVTTVTKEEVTVTIESTSACASCHAKGACGAADMSEKAVHVPVSDIAYQTGEHVQVMVKNSQGMLAVFFGYVFPLLLLLISLFALMPFFGEGTAGLSALGAVGIYYLILHLFKGQLSKKFTFEISKLQ